MCEFNVIGNKGTFDFSKQRKKTQSLKGCIFLGAIKNNWNSNTGQFNNYSHLFNKHGGWNKRGGWEFLEKTST